MALVSKVSAAVLGCVLPWFSCTGSLYLGRFAERVLRVSCDCLEGKTMSCYTTGLSALFQGSIRSKAVSARRNGLNPSPQMDKIISRKSTRNLL